LNRLRSDIGGKITKDPAKSVKLFRENNQRSRFLTEAEIRGLIEALDFDEDLVGAAILRFLLLTDARTGEAMAARWEHVDLVRRTWMLPVAQARPCLP
jgi:integrase